MRPEYVFDLPALLLVTLITGGLQVQAEGEVPPAPEVFCKHRLDKLTYEPTILVIWVEPSTNFSFESFHVSYTYDVLWSDEQYNESVVINGSKHHYEIVFPSWYSNYSIEVTAETDTGLLGEPGSCELQTSEGPPGEPQNMVMLQETSHSFTVQWEQPEMLNGILRAYTVAWRKNSIFSQVSHLVPVQEGQTIYNYTINNLKPSSYYLVKVWAHTVVRGLAATGTYVTKSSENPPDNTLLIVFCSLFGILSLLLLLSIAYIKRDLIRMKLARKRTNSSSSDPAE